jgi:hypothetical protein
MPDSAPLARPLLALVDELLAALAQIDPETGEVPAAAVEQLDALAVPLGDKAMAYRIADGRLRGDEDALRKLAGQITDRARAAAAARERLNARMQYALEQLGHAIKAPGVTAYLQPSSAVEITGDVPDEFVTVKVERVPNKRAIKAALEAGQQLPFARLVQSATVIYR